VLFARVVFPILLCLTGKECVPLANGEILGRLSLAPQISHFVMSKTKYIGVVFEKKIPANKLVAGERPSTLFIAMVFD
jgi:hypothetical protein